MSTYQWPLRFVAGGNAKLAADVITFSLPAGYSCPCAKDCLAKADIDTGRIVDGPDSKFRCYAASTEAYASNVRKSRHANMKVLVGARTTDRMKEVLLESMDSRWRTVRVHASGDFFSQVYFNAWMEAAKERPETLFYGYTKSLRFWAQYLYKDMNEWPDNFKLTASHGGREDHLIPRYGFPTSYVVGHPEEAEAMGLEIDHDDSRAMKAEGDFALLLHNTQPAGSDAAKKVLRMRREKVKFEYSKKK